MKKITSRWYREATAEHDAALAKPQRFRLTGDGERTEHFTATVGYKGSRERLAQDLARARYHDWKRRT